MPILRCYVTDDTMRILEREAIKRGREETPEQLAENAIADAAIMSVAPPIRQNFNVTPHPGYTNEIRRPDGSVMRVYDVG